MDQYNSPVPGSIPSETARPPRSPTAKETTSSFFGTLGKIARQPSKKKDKQAARTLEQHSIRSGKSNSSQICHGGKTEI